MRAKQAPSTQGFLGTNSRFRNCLRACVRIQHASKVELRVLAKHASLCTSRSKTNSGIRKHKNNWELRNCEFRVVLALHALLCKVPSKTNRKRFKLVSFLGKITLNPTFRNLQFQEQGVRSAEYLTSECVLKSEAYPTFKWCCFCAKLAKGRLC